MSKREKLNPEEKVKLSADVSRVSALYLLKQHPLVQRNLGVLTPTEKQPLSLAA